jgi:PKD repeat protein
MKSKLYYSFISIFLTIFLVFPGLTAFGQYAPNHIPGLKLWLRSDSAVVLNGSTVAQWNDCSGNSHNATQSNPALQPQYNPGVLNGYPGIYFDGNSTYLAGDVINGFDTTSASVFIVASGDAATGDVFRGFFAIGNHQFCISWETAMPGLSFSSGSTGVNYTWSTAPANILPTTGFPPKLILVRKQKGIQLEQFINYNLGFFTTGAGFTGSFTNTNFEIGRTSGFWAASHHGNIFEVLVFDKYLPDSLSAKVYLYLSHKYGGSPVSLGPDMLMNDFCPTVLHAGTQFSHYLWNTGDTTESITVNSNGSYHVRVTDIFGGVSSDTVKLTYPVITLHDTLICALDSVTLSTGLPGGFTYQWSSGQTTSTITVSDTGSYWVTVTKNSCSKTSNAIHITKDFFPVQASLGNDTSICSGNSIGLTHPVPLPSNLSYYWSTGDTTSRISLTNSGSYLVTVTNNNGCAARDTIQVTISGIAPSINFLNSSACSGDTVYFTNASSPMGDSWIWDFGDGNTSNLENPGHVFAFGGNYQVKLKVTSGGCSNELTKTIIIPSKPQAHFSLSAACIGNPYSFIDQSTASAGDTIVSYDWDFGDATLHSSLKDPDHIYSSAGNYVVVLNVTTDKGCSNSVSDTFTVVSTSPLPSQFSLNFPHPNAVVSSHIVTFEWNIGANTEKYALEYSSSLLFTNKTRIFPLITNQHQTYVNITGEVFWRVIAYNLCNDSTVSAERSFNIFLPNQVQGLQLWLRSDSAVALSGTNVSQWNDCSGNSHNTLQNDPDSIPAIIPNELNGYPGIHFNGTTSYLKGDVINGFDTTSASVFIVASGEPATGDVFRGFFTIGDHQFCVSWETVLQGLSFSGGGNYTWIGNGNLPASGFLPKILSVKKKKGVKVDQVINNVLYYSTSGASFTGPFTNTFFEIGRSNGQYAGYHKGNIFEVLVYNKYLPDSVSTKVFKYLNDKYAPSVNLGGDIEIPYGLCQTSLDAGPRFSHYYWSTGDTTQIINISQSGDYSVTATNIFDASSTDTIHVNMPSIVLHDTTFCLGDTLNIPANMGAGYSYLWLPDSVTSNNLTVFKPGNYSFTVFDTNNCFRTKSFTVVADSFAVIASLGPDRKMQRRLY